MKLNASLSADARPSPWTDLAGRLVICLGLVFLLFAIWSPRLDAVASAEQKWLRILPRLTVFVMSALLALIIRGAKPGTRFLLSAGACAVAVAVLLLPFADLQIRTPAPAIPGLPQIPVKDNIGAATPVLLLLRFCASFFAAIFFGACLGRGLNSATDLIGLLLCASIGDYWLNLFHVPEAVGAGRMLSLLRMPWPQQSGQLGLSPAFTDILVFIATIEGATRLRFHLPSMVAGGVAGYCAGSFLGLDPWPAWRTLSIVMFSSGVLVGCWPDLKCRIEETFRILLIASVLLVAMMGINILHHKLNPPPQPRVEPVRTYNAI